MNLLAFILLILAFVFALMQMLNVVSRINLIAASLACYFLSLLVAGSRAFFLAVLLCGVMLTAGCSETMKVNASVATRYGTFKYSGKEVLDSGADTTRKFDAQGNPNFGPAPAPTPEPKKWFGLF